MSGKKNYTPPDPVFVKNIFESISHRYDLANDIITGGMARYWRRKLIQKSKAKPGHRVLDCATGTGDLAIAFKKRVGEKGEVIACDFSPKMLEIARLKAKKQKQKVHFEQADIMELPYKDNFFDITSIAYGIRNLADPWQGLRELYRVTRPTGAILILETGSQANHFFQSMLTLYLKKIVPILGGLVSGNQSAYHYLQSSSQNFPSKQEFLKWMEETGNFSSLHYKVFLGHASFLYHGVKKAKPE